MRRAIRWARPFLPALALLSACQSWVPSAMKPSVAIATARADRVRIATTDGPDVILTDAHISGDSVIGTGDRGERTVIPLSRVSATETQQVDATKTFISAFTVVVISVIVLWIAASHYGAPKS